MLIAHLCPAASPDQPPKDAPVYLCEGNQEECLTPPQAGGAELTHPARLGLLGLFSRAQCFGLPAAILCAFTLAQWAENRNLQLL